MKKVSVVWVDALSRDEWSENIRDLPTIVTCESVGFLMKDDEHEVVLALNLLDEGGQHEGVSCAIAIPRGCIRSMRTLK